MHQSYDNPPDLPAFKGPEPKKRRESLTEVLSGAAIVFAEAISSTVGRQPTDSIKEGEHSNIPQSSSVSSPRKAVELRMKNYEQLRYIQQLYNDGILDEKEFNEQKSKILEFIQKIT